MITNTTRRFWFALLTIFAFLIRNRSFRKWFWVPVLILAIGFLVPQQMIVPVKGATTKSWDEKSFWAYPWGSSITHKGIDIFADRDTDVISSTNGVVPWAIPEMPRGNRPIYITRLPRPFPIHIYTTMTRCKGGSGCSI